MLEQQIQRDASSGEGVLHVQKICGTIRRPPKLYLLIVWFLCFSMAVLIFPATLQAKTEDTNEITATSPGKKAFAISVAPVFQLGSKVGGGGSLAVNNLYTTGTFVYQFTEHFGTGLSLFYNINQYRFSGVSVIPLSNPWGTIQNYGVGIPLIYSFSENWQFIVSPVTQYTGENGANWGSSIIYGGVGSISYNWGKASYINLGVAAFQWIGETDIFPYVDLNWHITESWRLSTTLQSSPVGPGGIKISYCFHPHWEFGITAGYRYNRFRLDKNGSLPNGVGQYSQIPVAAVITYTPHSLVNLNVFGGFAFNNKIWLETSDGSGIYKSNQRTAPLVGFNLTIGFEPSQFQATPWQITQLGRFLR
jgi:hypothetical protein